ncbi:hypothetical protein DPMN_165811 [Dreissena polymorpha]|uniref:Uncharacterized protein n=1 Tax=Dreissena polymorpha TaxID=45954 RepID=A0A9D4IWS9_DREPO|nr:hypothetical protein DPMN_165811 [Dreissena polymorpha]
MASQLSECIQPNSKTRKSLRTFSALYCATTSTILWSMTARLCCGRPYRLLVGQHWSLSDLMVGSCTR